MKDVEVMFVSKYVVQKKDDERKYGLFQSEESFDMFINSMMFLGHNTMIIR